MTKIKYRTGDATEPQGMRTRIIAHVCNDAGAWGAGFVLALSAKDRAPEFAYRDWYGNRNNKVLNILNGSSPFQLGEIQFAPFKNDFVCNMIAQRGVGGEQPLSYSALEQCLIRLSLVAIRIDASVHMPRIGCGLAGGTWDKVQPIIMRTLCAWNLPVTVYDLPRT